MAVFPIYGRFVGDFAAHLVAVDTEDTMDEIGAKVAAHVIGRRLPNEPLATGYEVLVDGRVLGASSRLKDLSRPTAAMVRRPMEMVNGGKPPNCRISWKSAASKTSGKARCSASACAMPPSWFSSSMDACVPIKGAAPTRGCPCRGRSGRHDSDVPRAPLAIQRLEWRGDQSQEGSSRALFHGDRLGQGFDRRARRQRGQPREHKRPVGRFVRGRWH